MCFNYFKFYFILMILYKYSFIHSHKSNPNFSLTIDEKNRRFMK